MANHPVVAAAPVALSAEQFRDLAEVPPEVEWFANLTNANTRRAYRGDVRGFMVFLGIAVVEDLRKIGRSHVLAWRKTIAHLAPATVRRKIAAVSSLFDYLCDRNAVMHNPVAGVQRPKEGSNQGKTPAISDRQARALLSAPDITTTVGKRDRAILTVLLFHGPRRAEVAGLKVGHLADRRGIPHLEFHGKGGKIRYLPAHPVAVAAINEYLAAAGHGTEKNDPMFHPLRNRTSAAGTGGGLTADSLWRVVMRYAKQVGINVVGFGPHSLRATAGTNALEHGADLAAVSEWLGHASITTTRLYDKRVVRVENSPTYRVSY
jgi:site-specific recombinase XerD